MILGMGGFIGEGGPFIGEGGAFIGEGGGLLKICPSPPLEGAASAAGAHATGKSLKRHGRSGGTQVDGVARYGVQPDPQA